MKGIVSTLRSLKKVPDSNIGTRVIPIRVTRRMRINQ